MAKLDWEGFRPTLEAIIRKSKAEAKGPGGRPANDSVMMFKIIMLEQWYNLSDEAAEKQINDRRSFMRFLKLGESDAVPDRTTIWLFKERLKQGERYEELFDQFGAKLEEEGVITHKGSIQDASFVDVPRQRNTREENEMIKAGKTPEEWQAADQAHKLRQKDVDASWAKKNNEVHYGYKDHVKVDAESKIIVDYRVTDAAVHDSQVFEEMFSEEDKVMYADSAYVGREMHERIAEAHPECEVQVNEKGSRGHALTEEQKEKNREKSKTRARVEHVFGHMTYVMCGMTIRTIGQERAWLQIGMKNLAYNIQRYLYLKQSKKAEGQV
jgi:IS5 family transposase